MPEQTNNTTPLRAMRGPGQRLTEAERETIQEKFLLALSKTANIRAACRAAGINRSTVYYWQEHDTEFSMRFNIANQEANDLLLAAAWERGVKGTEKPVVSMGKQVYVEKLVRNRVEKQPLMERVYSDSLLALLMKARMPEFRDKQQVDLHTSNTKDLQAVQEAIVQALSPYPEASVAVAAALAEMEKARGN